MSITLTSGNIIFFFLYRPPPSRSNRLTDSCLFSEFSFLLDLCNTLSSSSIILDLSVHLNMPTNHLVLKIYSLLNRHSFSQAVTVPTHKLGHTLDIIMLRPTDDIVCPTTVTSYFRLIITVLPVTFLQSNLLTIIINSHHQTVKKFTWHKFDNLWSRYMPFNFTYIMSYFLIAWWQPKAHEKHAPPNSCRLPIHRNDPWRYTMKCDIIAAKNIGIGQKDCT